MTTIRIMTRTTGQSVFRVALLLESDKQALISLRPNHYPTTVNGWSMIDAGKQGS